MYKWGIGRLSCGQKTEEKKVEQKSWSGCSGVETQQKKEIIGLQSKWAKNTRLRKVHKGIGGGFKGREEVPLKGTGQETLSPACVVGSRWPRGDPTFWI